MIFIKRKTFIIKHLISVILIFSNSLFSQEISSKELINRMLVSVGKINTLTYTLKKTERVKNQLLKGEQDVKLALNPKKAYVYVQSPNKGVEVLWHEGVNNGNALINPNGFPYVNVNFSPQSSHLRKNNHHTLHELGFDYIAGIIKNIMNQSGSKFNEYFLYEGLVTFDNRVCHKIDIDYKPFRYINYKILKGEDLVSIAKKFKISEFMILELNTNIHSYTDVSEGQNIVIPESYARRTILFIDQENYLPVVQRIYDDKGLYEQYEFYKLKLNPIIEPQEFTRHYPKYNF